MAQAHCSILLLEESLPTYPPPPPSQVEPKGGGEESREEPKGGGAGGRKAGKNISITTGITPHTTTPIDPRRITKKNLTKGSRIKEGEK